MNVAILPPRPIGHELEDTRDDSARMESLGSPGSFGWLDRRTREATRIANSLGRWHGDADSNSELLPTGTRAFATASPRSTDRPGRGSIAKAKFSVAHRPNV